MAIQSAVNGMLGTGAAATVAVKKGAEGQKQEAEKAAAEKAAKAEQGLRNEAEAKEAALQADLVRMGADQESAESYILARRMGLDGKGFGIIRKKGRFVGSYSSLAEKLSKDAITDSLSSRAMNDRGFTERYMSLGGSRKGRVEALIKASGGSKDGK